MNDDVALLNLELPGRTEAPAAARQALTALNGSLHLVSEERLREVQLVVSELVTNAYRHGGGRAAPIQLSVLATEDVLRVEISDPGSGKGRRRREIAASPAASWRATVIGWVER